MKIVDKSITLEELKQLAEGRFGDMVKAVVDVDKEVMVLDAEFHADEEGWLLESGSKNENLWGINLYPGVTGEDWIEFDSMINLRPGQNNRSRGVEDPAIREKIRSIVVKLVQR
jgi:hypothetical protein